MSCRRPSIRKKPLDKKETVACNAFCGVSYSAKAAAAPCGGRGVCVPGEVTLAPTCLCNAGYIQSGSLSCVAEGQAARCGVQLAFRANFTFSLSPQSGRVGNNGFAFVVSATDWVGNGSGVGYGGMDSRSMAVEFDTTVDKLHGDMSSPHVGLNIQGQDQSIAAVKSPFQLTNRKAYTAWVDYEPGEPGTIQVFLAATEVKPAQPLLERRLALCEVLQAGAEHQAFYFGFVASTTVKPFQMHLILKSAVHSAPRKPVDIIPGEQSLSRKTFLPLLQRSMPVCPSLLPFSLFLRHSLVTVNQYSNRTAHASTDILPIASPSSSQTHVALPCSAFGLTLSGASYAPVGASPFMRYMSADYLVLANQQSAWQVSGSHSWDSMPFLGWPVKNQKDCSASWAYAVVASVEAAYGIALNSEAPRLSVDSLFAAMGLTSLTAKCMAGGSPAAAFESLITLPSGGLTTDSKPGFERTRFKGYVGLMLAVRRQPVVVHIEASAATFVQYDGTFKYQDPACYTGNLDHAVLVVGYLLFTNNDRQSQIAPPFWIIRNSWGVEWGDRGHMRMDIQGGVGVCGINMLPGIYPIVKSEESTPLSGVKNASHCQSFLFATLCILSVFPQQAEKASQLWIQPTHVFTHATSSVLSTTLPVPKDPNPCAVGTCINDGKGAYSCICPPNYVGSITVDNLPTCDPANVTASMLIITGANWWCSDVFPVAGVSLAGFSSQNMAIPCNQSLPQGKVIKLGGTPTTPCTAFFYALKGDTCSSIGVQLGLASTYLASLNPGLDCFEPIKAGRSLCIERNNTFAFTVPRCLQYGMLSAQDTCESLLQQSMNSSGEGSTGAEVVTATSWTELYRPNPGIICPRTIPASSATIASGASTKVCLKADYESINAYTCKIGRRKGYRRPRSLPRPRQLPRPRLLTVAHANSLAHAYTLTSPTLTPLPSPTPSPFPSPSRNPSNTLNHFRRPRSITSVAHAQSLPSPTLNHFRRPRSITSVAHAQSLPSAHAHSLSVAIAQSSVAHAQPRSPHTADFPPLHTAACALPFHRQPVLPNHGRTSALFVSSPHSLSSPSSACSVRQRRGVFQMCSAIPHLPIPPLPIPPLPIPPLPIPPLRIPHLPIPAAVSVNDAETRPLSPSPSHHPRHSPVNTTPSHATRDGRGRRDILRATISASPHTASSPSASSHSASSHTASPVPPHPILPHPIPASPSLFSPSLISPSLIPPSLTSPSLTSSSLISPSLHTPSPPHPISSSPHLFHTPSPPHPISSTPHLLLTPSPPHRISSSPHLLHTPSPPHPISSTSHLLHTLSPPHPISSSPHLLLTPSHPHPISSSPLLLHTPSPPHPISSTPHLLLTPSPPHPISSSPHLLLTPSPPHPISSSPHLLHTASPPHPISSTPHLLHTPSPPHPISFSPHLLLTPPPPHPISSTLHLLLTPSPPHTISSTPHLLLSLPPLLPIPSCHSFACLLPCYFSHVTSDFPMEQGEGKRGRWTGESEVNGSGKTRLTGGGKRGRQQGRGWGEAGKGMGGSREGDGGKQGRGWGEAGKGMGGNREGDGGKQGRGWGESGKGMGGSKEGDGGKQGRGWGETGKGMGGSREGDGGKQGRGWGEAGKGMGGSREGVGGSRVGDGGRQGRGQGEAGKGMGGNSEGDGGKQGRGWGKAGKGMGGNREGDGGKQGRGWGESGKGMGGSREGDGGKQGRGWGETGKGMGGSREGDGGKQGRGWREAGKGMGGSREGVGGSRVGDGGRQGRGQGEAGKGMGGNSEGDGGKQGRGWGEAGKGMSGSREGDRGKQGRGWGESGKGMGGSREGDGGKQGRGWGETGKGMGGSREGDGGKQGRGWGETGKGMGGSREGDGGKQGRGWGEAGKGMGGSREGVGGSRVGNVGRQGRGQGEAGKGMGGSKSENGGKQRRRYGETGKMGGSIAGDKGKQGRGRGERERCRGESWGEDGGEQGN
ncbi:unnamed protein product [Closterium sp. NIES-65]|nr:unnamed protein product [Closterium sp. NIES-65]